MLQLSTAAARYVSQVRDEQGIPPEAPLRIAADSASGQLEHLQLGFVSEPAEGDQVNHVEDVAYCVAPDLVEATESAVLDIEHREDGVTFIVADQA